MTLLIDHTPADILIDWLVDQGVGNPVGGNMPWPIYASTMPDLEQDIIALTDTQGVIEIRNMDGTSGSRGGFQVRVKSKDQRTARRKVVEIWRKFDTLIAKRISHQNVNYRIHNIGATSDIIPMGQDPQRFFNFALNFLATISQEN